MNALDVLGFGAVLAILVFVGRRGAVSADAYLVANRSIGLFPLVATLVMTEFNTSTLLAFSAAGYRAGPMAIALPFVFLVAAARPMNFEMKHFDFYSRDGNNDGQGAGDARGGDNDGREGHGGSGTVEYAAECQSH